MSQSIPHHIYICFKWHVFPGLEHCLRLFNLVSQLFHRVILYSWIDENSPKNNHHTKHRAKGAAPFASWAKCTWRTWCGPTGQKGYFTCMKVWRYCPISFKSPLIPHCKRSTQLASIGSWSGFWTDAWLRLLAQMDWRQRIEGCFYRIHHTRRFRAE